MSSLPLDVPYKIILSQKSYPSTTPVVRVVDGYEPYEFIRLFPSWQGTDQFNSKQANLLGKFDALSLIQRPYLAAESQLIDDGYGDLALTIYRVSGSNGDIVEIPKRKNVALFSGDCYLIHYVVTVCLLILFVFFFSESVTSIFSLFAAFG